MFKIIVRWARLMNLLLFNFAAPARAAAQGGSEGVRRREGVWKRRAEMSENAKLNKVGFAEPNECITLNRTKFSI